MPFTQAFFLPWLMVVLPPQHVLPCLSQHSTRLCIDCPVKVDIAVILVDSGDWKEWRVRDKSSVIK